jgi:hypothetical protein
LEVGAAHRPAGVNAPLGKKLKKSAKIAAKGHHANAIVVIGTA